MNGLRAIMVAVDYGDLLAVTLPWNRHHFSEVHVVTEPKCEAEVRELCIVNHAEVHVTDLFYAKGATFNKWSALEWALDCIGRTGWLCLMDADVLWPKEAPLEPKLGELWSPLRRMAPWPIPGPLIDPIRPLPPECHWSLYPIHRNVNEWAGYSQVFHAQDPNLPAPPWHEVDWVHAGGADSFFQARWPAAQKRRPSWECLHLGEAGKNWYGRATPFADGSTPADAESKLEACARIWTERRRTKNFGGEKLSP
jgi:hypothetical protein